MRSRKTRRRGLTYVLPRVFFPKLAFKRLAKRPPNVGGLSKRRACARGRKVDSDLARLVTKTSLERNSTLEARVIFAFLRKMHARVVGAQLRVASPLWDVVTYVDLVVLLEKTQEHVVVEVKRGCGYRDCSVPHAFSQHLEPALPVKPRHLHELQALVGARLWEMQEQKVARDVWLLYVNETELEFTSRAQFGATWSPNAELALISRKK